MFYSCRSIVFEALRDCIIEGNCGKPINYNCFMTCVALITTGTKSLIGDNAKRAMLTGRSPRTTAPPFGRNIKHLARVPF